MDNYDYYKIGYNFSIEVQNEIEKLQLQRYEKIVARNLNANSAPMEFIWFYACKDFVEAINYVNSILAEQINFNAHILDADKWIDNISKLAGHLYQWDRSVHLSMTQGVIKEIADIVYKENYLKKYGKQILDEVINSVCVYLNDKYNLD